VRINLLVPDAAAQKRKQEEERRAAQEVWQLGSSTALDNLKEIASRRTDIFGHGDIEVASKQEEKPRKTIWDFADTAPAVPPVQEEKKYVPPPPSSAPRLPEVNVAPRVVPAPPVPAPVAPAPLLRPPVMPSPMMSVPLNAAPQNKPMFPAPAPLIPGMPLGVTPGFPGMSPFGGIAPAPPVNIPIAAEPPEPPAKRSKTEEHLERLQPEDEFLKSHSGPVTFTVSVTTDDGNSSLTVTREITEKVSELKQHLQELINMPVGKQKLTIGELVLNNGNSLAFYNVTSATLCQVSTKERGGRKK